MTTSGGGGFLKNHGKRVNRSLKTVWAANSNKTGEGAEYLWSKIHKKGAYENG
jgi:hypothetical protein